MQEVWTGMLTWHCVACLTQGQGGKACDACTVFHQLRMQPCTMRTTKSWTPYSAPNAAIPHLKKPTTRTCLEASPVVCNCWDSLNGEEEEDAASGDAALTQPRRSHASLPNRTFGRLRRQAWARQAHRDAG